MGSRVGGVVGWGGWEGWEENGDDCTWTIKKVLNAKEINVCVYVEKVRWIIVF